MTIPGGTASIPLGYHSSHSFLVLLNKEAFINLVFSLLFHLESGMDQSSDELVKILCHIFRQLSFFFFFLRSSYTSHSDHYMLIVLLERSIPARHSGNKHDRFPEIETRRFETSVVTSSGTCERWYCQNQGPGI